MVKKFLKEWGIPLVIAYAVAILINKFLIFTVYIPSESMLPAINAGDRLIAQRVYDYGKIKRGDILVFDFKEEDSLYIKRVIGLPGDTILIDGKNLYVNGEKITEDYVKFPEETFAEYVVPEKSYFFLGDNRANSKDARYWKNPYIKEEDIKGKAIFRYYPFDNIGKLK
ncbi:MAG: signal peptidase I [Clostridium sp.]|uniref:signal peptidase I n=1 Tax=Clostridium sp. TaxID=1506 RepID=UPI003F41A998